jgi:hypothetical protein
VSEFEEAVLALLVEIRDLLTPRVVPAPMAAVSAPVPDVQVESSS